MPIQHFESVFAERLPDTFGLLNRANFTLHPAVNRVILHGSRGLAGGSRPDSDVDLSLIVDTGDLAPGPRFQTLLHAVLQTTLVNWQAPVEADLAAVFDLRGCGLACFGWTEFSKAGCPLGGADCFGLYKEQKGFHGFVDTRGIQVKRMLPCLQIWSRI
jgi:hypothetical protein